MSYTTLRHPRSISLEDLTAAFVIDEQYYSIPVNIMYELDKDNSLNHRQLVALARASGYVWEKLANVPQNKVLYLAIPL